MYLTNWAKSTGPTSKSTGSSPSRLPVDVKSTGSLEGDLPVDLEVGASSTLAG